MRFQRIAIPAVLVAALAVPFSAAKAQYYYPPPCHPFPLFWPVCAAAAIVGTAGAIVTAPFRAVAPYPYYYGAPASPYYYQQAPGYAAPAYYGAPGYYGPR
jgi:hypothetical protein